MSARTLLRARAFALAASLSLSLGACASTGAYTWVSGLPADAFSPPTNEYLIRDGDTVSVRVFGQENMSTRAKVRSDGRLSMPMLGDVEMRGKRPSALKAELEARLKDYVNGVNVTVSVEEFQPITVSVLGEVARQGMYPVDPRATVAQVLAAAGGLTDYAGKDKIFVVRSGAKPMRVRFSFEDGSRGEPRSASFALQQGDLVVVE